jgi:hypothetical protein
VAEQQKVKAGGSARLSHAMIVDEGDSTGAGLQLSFSRTDVRQLTQLKPDWQSSCVMCEKQSRNNVTQPDPN